MLKLLNIIIGLVIFLETVKLLEIYWTFLGNLLEIVGDIGAMLA